MFYSKKQAICQEKNRKNQDFCNFVFRNPEKLLNNNLLKNYFETKNIVCKIIKIHVIQ
jgi:hypothetical protein